MNTRLLRHIGIWGLGIAVLVGIGWGMVKLSEQVPLPNDGSALTVPVTDADHSQGPADAPIVLVEYGDLQCPACGAFHPIVVRMMAEPDLKDKVRLVFRNFPLTSLHANAQLAAQAVEAAALQGKFWEFHDRLYENQSAWSGLSGAGAQAIFVSYATDLKLDIAKFTKDLDSGTVKDRIAADVAGGNSAGVNGTPTFFVNGKKMPPPASYDQFKEYVSQGLR